MMTHTTSGLMAFLPWSRREAHNSFQMLSLLSGDIVPTPSVKSPISSISFHSSRRIVIDGSVAVNACAIRAAYLDGCLRTFEKSPSDALIEADVTKSLSGC